MRATSGGNGIIRSGTLGMSAATRGCGALVLHALLAEGVDELDLVDLDEMVAADELAVLEVIYRTTARMTLAGI